MMLNCLTRVLATLKKSLKRKKLKAEFSGYLLIKEDWIVVLEKCVE